MGQTLLENLRILDVANDQNQEQNLFQNGMRDNWTIIVMPSQNNRQQIPDENAFIEQLRNQQFFLALREKFLRYVFRLRLIYIQ